jgi:hypothetical protein
MAENILKTLQDNKIVLFISSQNSHADTLAEVARQAQRVYAALAIISYRTTSGALEAALSKAGVKTKNCFFLDPLTGNAKKASANTLLTSSPADFTEMGLSISELLKTGNFPFVLFDSPAAMLLYQDHETVLQFMHSIITKCRVAGIQLAFVAVESAASQELIKDLHLFVDDVLNLEEGTTGARLVEAFK